MLTELLESNHTRTRRRAGIVSSAIIHAAVLGLGAYVTRATAAPLLRGPERPIIFTASASAPEGKSRPSIGGHLPASPTRPISTPPIPPIDVAIPNTPSAPGLSVPAASDPYFAGPVGPALGTGQPASADPNSAFTSVQVEREAAALPGAPLPRYPAALEVAGMTGRVRVQFVVDTTGRARIETMRVIISEDPLFTRSVRDAVGATRYRPAMLGGRKVAQWVEQAFEFREPR